MHATIAEKKDELIALCRRYDVARLEVFGASARGSDFDPENSEAEFFVEFKPETKLDIFDRYFDMLFDMEDTLGRPVELARRHLITNPYRQEIMFKDTELVFECDEMEGAA